MPFQQLLLHKLRTVTFPSFQPINTRLLAFTKCIFKLQGTVHHQALSETVFAHPLGKMFPLYNGVTSSDRREHGQPFPLPFSQANYMWRSIGKCVWAELLWQNPNKIHSLGPFHPWPQQTDSHNGGSFGLRICAHPWVPILFLSNGNVFSVSSCSSGI